MNFTHLKTLCFSILALCSTLLTAQGALKSSIKANGEISYNKPQKQVSHFLDMFSEGEFYGRLRNNNFLLSFKENGDTISKLAGAVGATLVYKSANYSGFDFNLGLYTTYSFFNESDYNYIKGLKAKDTFSRSNYENYGESYMAVLGQLNLNYRLSQTKFTLGRQLVETFYTRSNDTKMIPNTFDGLVLLSHDIPNTQLTLAYLVKQKLRDHTASHAILMYGDANSSSKLIPKWTENDDSAMHRGLTYTALKALGKPTDAPLIVLDVTNKSLKNTKIRVSSYIVVQLISQVMTEATYTLKMHGFSISPSVRYIQQFDNGAGAVGGASLLGGAAIGYKNPTSLEAKMIAAKVVTKVKDYKLNLAYTQILDEADLVTPWRGFPTAGYTRSMGIYNWRANTKSYRIELVKGANDKGIYTKPFIQSSILYLDTDANKAILEDSFYYYAGLVQNIPSFPALQYRVRFGYRDFIGDASSVSNYLDSRLEFNYIF